jgi:hypothetical protein
MSETPLQRAQKSLAIQDVYVSAAHAWADRTYDPTVALPQPINLQLKVEPADDSPMVTKPAEGEGGTHIVRFFIDTGVRIVKHGVDMNPSEITQAHLLGEVTATFVLRYTWQPEEAPTAELLTAFIDNAIHHMWPYWREFLQTSTARLRLPAFILPMRVVAQQPETDATK